MSKEALTHSDRYVRKTNRVIMIVGIITLLVFLFGVILLTTEQTEEAPVYQVDDTIDAETDFDVNSNNSNEVDIEFNDAEELERPITMEPNPINMGQVVLGNDATNVLTIGTNSKATIKIVSVELEEAAFEGFSYETDCKDKILRGENTCLVTMKWVPSVAANVQNNFKIIWYETHVSAANAKHDEVPVYGSAVHKEDCNFCDTTGAGVTGSVDIKNKGKFAIGPDGKIIGIIGEDGIVRDADGNEIGRVNADGLIVDKDGNIIGVASTDKLILDANGNVIGYVDAKGNAYDLNGNPIGNMLGDGSIIDTDGKLIGKAVATGYVYDENGNIIGRVLEDGSVVDLNGNVIGRINEKGEVVDFNGNVIGRISKSGEVAFDENGNILGVVMPNGTVANENGDIVGFVDENDGVYQKQIIGKRGSTAQLAVDENGNVIGYIDENGNVRDFAGNIIGRVDENGNVVDKDGNIIGRASEKWADLALDENGNVIGYIDEDGLVRNSKGEIIGYVEEDGSIVGNKGPIEGQPIIGKRGETVDLAVDENGNVIGYIDEEGNVRDFNGNIIGQVDENGNIIDKDGNIIGRRGEKGYLALDKNGNLIGYIDKNGLMNDKNGRIRGIVDRQGNIRLFGLKRIGSLLDKSLLPITPDGKVLGEINNRGEIVSQNKIVGKMRPNGIVTDKTGAKILAQGVSSGYIVNWGCNFERRLDRDGIVRLNGEETDDRVYSDGTVWTIDGKFAGRVMKTGSVYDNECVYIGEAGADGYVRDSNNNEIGCLNPDGTVLDLEQPRIKGHLVDSRVVMSLDWEKMGILEANGTLRDENNEILGCVNGYGEVYDRDMAFIGNVSKAKYAFSFDGKLLGLFDKEGNISLPNTEGAHVFLNNLIADASNKIIGFAAPAVNILIDARGNILGHLFPDGNVYDREGTIVDKFSGNGLGLYNGEPAKFLETGQVVDVDGQNLGYINYDMSLVDSKGSILGKVDAKGQIYDDTGRQIGGIVKQGGVRGYNGAYLGYVTANGDVVELQNGEDGFGNKYQKGDITGQVVPDGHVIKDNRVIGEVLPQTVMVDLFGSYKGFSNAYGLVVSPDKNYISAILPGGVTNDNILALPQGFVIDFAGNIIGSVLPNGQFMNSRRTLTGFVLADGKVASYEGKLLGEVISGDIVIGNDDKVKGRIGFDGKIYSGGTIIGRLLTDGLAVDNQNNVLGHAYNIGNTVLSNNGDFIGRLSANGKVIEDENKEIGYIKSNGSFIDADKNVSGYLLPEVAKNRRN